MTAPSAEIVASLRGVLAAHARGTNSGTSLPDMLWSRVELLGFTRVGVGEAEGGSGGNLDDVAAIVRTWAGSADTDAVPLGQQLLVSNWLRSKAGFEPCEGPTAAAIGTEARLSPRGGGTAISGSVSGILWADVGERFLIGARDASKRLHLVDLGVLDDGVSMTVATAGIGPAAGYAELRDVHVGAARTWVLGDTDAAELHLRRQLLATLQIAGALDGMLSLTRNYARTRQQFGRPIDQFQMVKSHLARLAGETLLTGSAADAAVQAATELGVAAAELPIRAARVQAAQSATTASRLAHQIHGTIGITAEYSLHHFTRQAWFWRDFGSREIAAQRALGSAVSSGGSSELWANLVGE